MTTALPGAGAGAGAGTDAAGAGAGTGAGAGAGKPAAPSLRLTVDETGPGTVRELTADQVLHRETELHKCLMPAPDAFEGPMAHVERRTPQWKLRVSRDWPDWPVNRCHRLDTLPHTP